MENKKKYGVDLMTTQELKATISKLGAITNRFRDLAENYVDLLENQIFEDSDEEVYQENADEFDSAQADYDKLAEKLNKEVK